MKTNKTTLITLAFLLGIGLTAGIVWVLKSQNQQAMENHENPVDETHVDLERAHDEDQGHEGHDEEKVVRLSDSQINEFGIEVKTAGPGPLDIYIELPGEVKVNADRLAHVVPRVPGIVRSVRKSLGNPVKGGEVMAVLESRELADTKASFLAAHERVGLAQTNFLREENLWKKKISSEQEYLEAKQALAEAKIELRSAEQKLHALGFTDPYLKALPEHAEESFTRYEIIAPFDGTVIEKHIALGEVLRDDAEAFTVADLSSVWVDLSVYQRDLPFVREGQEAVISASHGIQDAIGKISYLRPVIGEETRTALARIVLPNTGGKWSPGLFITGKISVEEVKVPVRISKSALQTVDDQAVVFILDEDGFEPRGVVPGRSDKDHIEITSGIQPGQEYVAKGAFTLKAQLSKGAFGDGHAH